MIKRLGLSRAQWVVASAMLVLAALLLWGIAWLLLDYTHYQREIRSLEPRLARLAGLWEVEARLQASGLRAAAEVDGLVYNVTEETGSLGAQMQKSVRELFTSAGMSVTGTQILTPREEEHFTRIGVGINASGDIEALEAVLVQILEARPLVFVDRLDIRPERRRRSRAAQKAQDLQVRVQLISMKLDSP